MSVRISGLTPLVPPDRRGSSRGSYSEGCAADVAWRIRSDSAPLSSIACADFRTSIPSCQGFPTLGTNFYLSDHSGHFPETIHDSEAAPRACSHIIRCHLEADVNVTSVRQRTTYRLTLCATLASWKRGRISADTYDGSIAVLPSCL